MITQEQIQNETIKALSWKEPFGSLMLPPHLKVETRTWNTNYRGLVLICTSKSIYRSNSILQICGWEQGARIFELASNGKLSLQLGKAIAIGRLFDVQPMLENHADFCFVKYQPGLYSHVYTDVTPIEPFDWKGSQGFRNVTDEQKKLIKIKI